jgi:hypothetical protein
MTEDMDLVSEDASVRKNGVTLLQNLCRNMKHMGGKIMAGINYSSWPRKLLPGEDKKAATDRAIEGVREAVKAAKIAASSSASSKSLIASSISS